MEIVNRENRKTSEDPSLHIRLRERRWRDLGKTSALININQSDTAKGQIKSEEVKDERFKTGKNVICCGNYEY